MIENVRFNIDVSRYGRSRLLFEQHVNVFRALSVLKIISKYPRA